MDTNAKISLALALTSLLLVKDIYCSLKIDYFFFPRNDKNLFQIQIIFSSFINFILHFLSDKHVGVGASNISAFASIRERECSFIFVKFCEYLPIFTMIFAYKEVIT